MISLNTLSNTTRPKQKPIRVGRGTGSGKGKTCGRGEKGASSRSGYKQRHGYEGGQFRLYMKLPERGFNNTRFRTSYESINLSQIDRVFEAGELVNADSLRARGIINSTKRDGIKLLGRGELTKKLTIEVHGASESVRHKAAKSGSQVRILSLGS